jgi:ATP-dependent RNA helicase DDX18/HAS1
VSCVTAVHTLNAGGYKLNAGGYKLNAGGYKLNAGGYKLNAGGYKLKIHRDGLKEGPDVVVGTPGRLSELIKAQELRLDNCMAVVMDEVDVLLGEASLFQEQVCHALLVLRFLSC